MQYGLKELKFHLPEKTAELLPDVEDISHTPCSGGFFSPINIFCRRKQYGTILAFYNSMKLKSISPFYSIALTLLAAAACGYLNKERLIMKNPLKTNETKVNSVESTPGTVAVQQTEFTRINTNWSPANRNTDMNTGFLKKDNRN